MSGGLNKPTTVLCKDGSTFLVTGTPGHVTVFATFRDNAVISTGLGRYQTFHEPGDLRAEHTGMPVEIVRAYAKAHGGVAEAGETALALLKTLPSEAAPDQGAPVTDSLAPAAVDGLKLDELTPAVIEARRVVSAVGGTVKQRLEAFCRLTCVADARYERHPLREEALRLRVELSRRVI